MLKLKIKYLKHQKQFRNSTSRVKALVAGFGAGKSRSGAIEAIMHSMLDQNMPHLVISPSYTQAKDSIIRSIFDVLQDNFVPPMIEGKDFTYNKSDHNFIFHHPDWTGEILCRSADNPKALKGSNVGSVVLDEPGIMSEDAYDQALARCRHPKAKYPQISLVGTGEGLNWYYEVCEGGKKPKDITVIHARTQDNPYNAPGYAESLLEKYDAQLVKAYLNGQFVNMKAGSAYHQFTDSNIWEGEYIPDPTYPLLIGFDYNWTPNVAVLGQLISVGGKEKLLIFDEMFLTNASTEAKCERILEKYPGFGYKIYGDASANNRASHGVGKSDLDIVRNSFTGSDMRMFIDAANPKRIDRLNAVNAKLCNSLGYRFVQITKNCKNLIADFRKCGMEEFLNDSFKDKSLGHISDAIGYLIHYKWPIRSKGLGKATTDKEL